MWAMRWFPTLILNLLQFHQCHNLAAPGNITAVTGLDSLVVFVVIIINIIINNNLWMRSILHHGKDALCPIQYFILCNLDFSIQFVFCFEWTQSEFFFQFLTLSKQFEKPPFSRTTLLPGTALFSDDLQTHLFLWRNWPVSDLTPVWSYSQSIHVKRKKKQRLITFSNSQQFA